MNRELSCAGSPPVLSVFGRGELLDWALSRAGGLTRIPARRRGERGAIFALV